MYRMVFDAMDVALPLVGLLLVLFTPVMVSSLAHAVGRKLLARLGERGRAPQLGKLIDHVVHAAPLCMVAIIGMRHGPDMIPGCGSRVQPFCRIIFVLLTQHMMALFLLVALTLGIRSFANQYLDGFRFETDSATYSGVQDGVSFTDRRRLVSLSPAEELRLGESLFNSEKREIGPSKILSENHQDSERVRRIATKIAEAAVKIKRRTHDFVAGCDVIVVNDGAIVAWCLPGCKIAVYTGMLDKLRQVHKLRRRDDDAVDDDGAEIAAVLSHEVGHAIARHGAEKKTWIQAELKILSLYIYFTRLIKIIPNWAAEYVIHTLHDYLFKLPTSRSMEEEADHIGLFLFAAAGYHPRVAPSVFEKLAVVLGDSTSDDFLATHSSWRTRAESMSQDHIMEKALELYINRSSQMV